MKEKILEIFESIIQNTDIYCVSVKVSSQKSKTLIQIFADSDVGITLDQCAELSRVLEEKLDSLAELSNDYILEISSPGLGNPLTHERQFRKQLGKEVTVSYLTDDNKSKSEDFILENYENDMFQFLHKKKGQFIIHANNVKYIKLKLNW